MKAITIWQPWASLLAHGVKLFETRGWQPPRSVVGECIAIHAGKDTRGIKLFEAEHDADSFWRRAMHRIIKKSVDLHDLPKGAIIATANLAYSVATDSEVGLETGEAEKALGDWSPGRYAWRLCEPKLLETPIECPGKQGLWDLTLEQLTQVLKA